MNITAWLRYARLFGLYPRQALILLFFSSAATLAETVGIGIFLPIFQYIRRSGDLEVLAADSRLWEFLIGFYAFFGIEVGLAVLLASAFAFFLARQGFTFARLLYEVWLQERMLRHVRREGFARYLAADSAYHDAMPVGDLVNAMTTEARSAVLAVKMPLTLISYIFIALCYLALLVALSPVMTAASVVVLALSAWFVRGWMRKSAETGRWVTDANTMMSAFLVGRLKSPRLVRLSGTEAAEEAEMAALTERQRVHSVRAGSLRARLEVAVEPIIVALSCVFLYVAATAFQMQIEEIGLYLLVVLRLMPVAKTILGQRQKFLAGLGAMEAVAHRLAAMSACRERDTGTRDFAKVERAIRLKDVTFRYPGAETPALDRVTFDIPTGRITAIVGPSGGGKSTLIDLLPKLRRPQEGEILFDRTPITDFTLRSLRQGIAYLAQAPQIFDVTVAEHIRYGNPAASEAEVEEAARLAGADEFIAALPQGYETRLGEDGVRLSGGQRQRLDLARALVRHASILVLDEPTSNLDAEAEDAFRRVLARIRERTDMTVIIVAHRLSTVAGADQIVVLNQGRVEAVGTHEELHAAGGWYAHAFESQQGVYGWADEGGDTGSAVTRPARVLRQTTE